MKKSSEEIKNYELSDSFMRHKAFILWSDNGNSVIAQQHFCL